MSTPALVPIYDPSGTLRDVPFDQMKAAMANGGIMAHPVKAPDGVTRMVPVNRLDEAVKNGGQILPMDENFAPQHAGFWQNLYGDLANMAESAPQMLHLLTPAGPRLYGQGATGGGAEVAQQQMEQTAKNFEQRKAAGNSLPYRVAAAAAESTGTDVKGMEESATEGDPMGVLGHAAAVPVAMGATEGLTKGVPAAARGAARGAGAVLDAARPGLRATGASLTGIGESLNPDLVGIISPRAAHLLRLARQGGKVASALGEEKPVYPGAPFPEVPTQEMAQSRSLTQTPRSATVEPEAASAGTGEGLPRTLQGDSALRKILTGQDNANLMKIAKSRGINVARESQLKPGAADNLLINKIIDDFQPDELNEIRDRYIESTRFRHDFGDIGPDAWKTISLQTYFPDLKLPKTAIAKTHASILKAAGNRIEKAAPAADEDLTDILQKSLAAAKARP